MRWSEITEQTSPMPDDLAWRLVMTKYKDIPSFVPSREGKMFAMPFQNWVGTYISLTGKDVSKLKYMKTQVVRVPPNAMVADMKIFDNALEIHGADMTEKGRAMLQHYENSMVPYTVFKKNPGMFANPEILMDRGSVIVTDLKLQLNWDKNGPAIDGKWFLSVSG